MAIPIIGDIIDAVGGLVSEVVVDKDKKNELLFKIEQLKDKSDERFHEELLGQIEVNKVEAGHSSLFVAGWRPFIGWVGGVGLAYNFIVSPFIDFMVEGPMPELDSATLLTLVLAMLGVGAQRSFDKVKGVGTNSIGKGKL